VGAIFGIWNRLHHRSWPLRFAVKFAIVLATVLAVCYPHPRILVRHISHLRRPSALVDAGAPQLASLDAELSLRLGGAVNPPAILAAVEGLVEDRIVYAFDWDTWGVVDYLPTVAEVTEKGREDCDGRAVLAASLLRRRGIAADLVTDGTHVWVWTPFGQTMSPTGVATWHATDQGGKFDWRGLGIIPRGTAYGLAVFPWARELIVLAVAWGTLLRPGGGRARAVGSMLFLLAAVPGSPWPAKRWWWPTGRWRLRRPKPPRVISVRLRDASAACADHG